MYGGADGDYIDDAGLGIKVASLKAKGVQQGTQGTQMLLLKQADWEAPINPYVAPSDLVVFWGDSTSYGTIASSFQGGRGRSASGERVRRVLNFGTFTGNGYMDDASGHGRFLRTWTGLQFESMSLRCCKSLLVPPMERDLPIASEQDQLSRKIRSFVANGNQLILTGGDYSSLVFLNRFFHYNLRKTVYDQGPFEKMPAKSMPENAIKDFAALPDTLPQLGLSVTTITKDSLPADTRLIYATPVSSPVFEITFCQTSIPDDQCAVIKPQGYSCVMDALPRDCKDGKMTSSGRACSCGTIVYIGNDFVEHHSHQMGRSVWDRVLRAVADMPKIGTPGLGQFTQYM